MAASHRLCVIWRLEVALPKEVVGHLAVPGQERRCGVDHRGTDAGRLDGARRRGDEHPTFLTRDQRHRQGAADLCPSAMRRSRRTMWSRPTCPLPATPAAAMRSSGPPRASSCALANRRWPAVHASMSARSKAKDAARVPWRSHETRRHSVVAGWILVLSGRVGPKVLPQRPLPPNPVRQRRSEENDLRAPDATHPAGLDRAEPAPVSGIHRRGLIRFAARKTTGER